MNTDLLKRRVLGEFWAFLFKLCHIFRITFILIYLKKIFVSLARIVISNTLFLLSANDRLLTLKIKSPN